MVSAFIRIACFRSQSLTKMHRLQEWQAPVGQSICFGLLMGVDLTNNIVLQNKQCDVAMNSALASKALSSPSDKLSDDGKTLVKDLRNVVEQAKKMMLTKNEGQLLQEFIWGAQNLNVGTPNKPEAPESKDKAKQDADKATEDLKTLGTLLITNGEFRKLCKLKHVRI